MGLLHLVGLLVCSPAEVHNAAWLAVPNPSCKVIYIIHRVVCVPVYLYTITWWRDLKSRGLHVVWVTLVWEWKKGGREAMWDEEWACSVIRCQQKLSQWDTAVGHGSGRNGRMFFKCGSLYDKINQPSNPASVLTASLSGQGRGRGYERELHLINGLKGMIYEQGQRVMNM